MDGDTGFVTDGSQANVIKITTATEHNELENVAKYVDIPILQEGNQNYILATNSDGNTVLLEASQLAMLAQHSVPTAVYDGTSVFQITSQDSSSKQGGTSTRPIIHEINAQNIAPVQSNKKGQSNEPGHKCIVCFLEFASEKRLWRHLRVHVDEKPYLCDKCGSSFNKEINLNLHKAMHDVKDPKCPECNKKFTRLAGLKAHLMLHEVEDNLVCTECGDEFSTQYKLDRHMNDHMEDMMDKSFVCKICSSAFKKLNELKEHSKMHNKLKTSLHRKIYKKNIDRSHFSHKCFFCGKQFQKPSQLVRHNRIHTGERPYKCDICNKSFNQKGALRIHIVKHTGERPYPCEFCPATFAQKGNLRNHIRRVHTLMVSNSPMVHKCELCSCAFRKVGSLNAHMSRVHSDTIIEFASKVSRLENLNDASQTTDVIQQLLEMSKQSTSEEMSQDQIKRIAEASKMSADILQQALENSGLASAEAVAENNGMKDPKSMVMAVSDAAGAVNRHIMRNVGGVRWYQCLYCSKEFKKPSDLVRHIRIHTHEKPYKCNQCFRSFAVKSTLKAHIRTHLGKKEFSCEYCRKLFSTSGSLKVHLLLHTGVKPFKCTMCSKAFRTSGHRNSHMLSHEKEKKAKKAKSTKTPKSSDIDVSNVTLQEPILITDSGFIQPLPKYSALYNQIAEVAGERPYRCRFCERSFKKSSHMKQHERSHTGEKPFECNICHRMFVSKGVLKAHLKTHSGIKAFACDICETTFTTNGSLKRHMCIHSNDRPYMCPYCQKTFKTSMNCKKHMKTHRYELAMGMASGVQISVISNGMAGEIPVRNDLANTVGEHVEAADADNIAASHLPQTLTQDVSGIIEHAPGFDQNQGNIFSLTSTDFVENQLTLQPDTLHDNYTTATADTLVSTNMPSILQTEHVFESTEGLENVECVATLDHDYEETESSKKTDRKAKYKCMRCCKGFKKINHLKQHIRWHAAKTPHTCTTCGLAFDSDSLLVAHRKIHDAIQEFKCNICNIDFTTKGSLEKHVAAHDKIQCSYCSQSFSTRKLYKAHIKHFHEDIMMQSQDEVPSTATVSEEPNSSQKEPGVFACHVLRELDYTPKPLNRCTYCPKGFKKPSDLLRHLRIHTGEKPFSCDSCFKRFTVKSSLDSHLKTHTGEKNFSCHVCLSRFSTKGSLKVHMRLHTGSKPFKCPHCDLQFRTSGHRKSHMTSHFKERSAQKRKSIRSLGAELSKTQNGHAIDDNGEAVANIPESDDVLHQEEIVTTPDVNQQNSVAVIQHQSASEPTVVATNQEQGGFQVHIPPNFIGQNIQITTLNPSLLPKPIQVDGNVLQQWQPHVNINITVSPSALSEGQTDINRGQTIVNVDPTSSLPVTAHSGTITVNPNMIIQQLGFAVTPQQQIISPENHVVSNVAFTIPDPRSSKDGNAEIYQNVEVVQTSDVTSEVIIPHGNSETGKGFENVDNFSIANVVNIIPPIDDTSPPKDFPKEPSRAKTSPSKISYHCKQCSKDFKKKNLFEKHIQMHA